MRSEHEIRKDLAVARAEYEAIANTAGAPVVAAAAAVVKGLLVELSARLAAGAEPCPDCGAVPHGMLRRPGVYEVGCLGHPVDQPHAAQGATVEAAVEAWNSKYAPARPVSAP